MDLSHLPQHSILNFHRALTAFLLRTVVRRGKRRPARGQGSPVGPALPELGRELALALAGHARALADEMADLSGKDLFRAMDGYRGPLRTQQTQPSLVA